MQSYITDLNKIYKRAIKPLFNIIKQANNTSFLLSGLSPDQSHPSGWSLASINIPRLLDLNDPEEEANKPFPMSSKWVKSIKGMKSSEARITFKSAKYFIEFKIKVHCTFLLDLRQKFEGENPQDVPTIDFILILAALGGSSDDNTLKISLNGTNKILVEETPLELGMDFVVNSNTSVNIPLKHFYSDFQKAWNGLGEAADVVAQGMVGTRTFLNQIIKNLRSIITEKVVNLIPDEDVPPDLAESQLDDWIYEFEQSNTKPDWNEFDSDLGNSWNKVLQYAVSLEEQGKYDKSKAYMKWIQEKANAWELYFQGESVYEFFNMEIHLDELYSPQVAYVASKLPDSISELSIVGRLEIYNNTIKTLPRTMSTMGFEEIILKCEVTDDGQVVSDNFTSLPENIGEFAALKILNIQYTNITTLPSSLERSTTLEELYLPEKYVAGKGYLPSVNLSQALIKKMLEGSIQTNLYASTLQSMLDPVEQATTPVQVVDSSWTGHGAETLPKGVYVSEQEDSDYYSNIFIVGKTKFKDNSILMMNSKGKIFVEDNVTDFYEDTLPSLLPTATAAQGNMKFLGTLAELVADEVVPLWANNPISVEKASLQQRQNLYQILFNRAFPSG